MNNPIKNTDPSGNKACEDSMEDCGYVVENGRTGSNVIRNGPTIAIDGAKTNKSGGNSLVDTVSDIFGNLNIKINPPSISMPGLDMFGFLRITGSYQFYETVLGSHGTTTIAGDSVSYDPFRLTSDNGTLNFDNLNKLYDRPAYGGIAHYTVSGGGFFSPTSAGIILEVQQRVRIGPWEVGSRERERIETNPSLDIPLAIGIVYAASTLFDMPNVGEQFQTWGQRLLQGH